MPPVNDDHTSRSLYVRDSTESASSTTKCEPRCKLSTNIHSNFSKKGNDR